MVSVNGKKAILKKKEALERGLRVEEQLEIGAIQSEAALASTDRPVDDSHIEDILSLRGAAVVDGRPKAKKIGSKKKVKRR